MAYLKYIGDLSLLGEDTELSLVQLTQLNSSGGQIKVGRSPECQITLLKDNLPQQAKTAVSRIHAVITTAAIETEEGTDDPEKVLLQYYIADQKSTNGTFVNGVRIQPFEDIPLHHNDEIVFGGNSGITIGVPKETWTAAGKLLLQNFAYRFCVPSLLSNEEETEEEEVENDENMNIHNPHPIETTLSTILHPDGTTMNDEGEDDGAVYAHPEDDEEDDEEEEEEEDNHHNQKMNMEKEDEEENNNDEEEIHPDEENENENENEKGEIMNLGEQFDQVRDGDRKSSVVVGGNNYPNRDYEVAAIEYPTEYNNSKPVQTPTKNSHNPPESSVTLVLSGHRPASLKRVTPSTNKNNNNTTNVSPTTGHHNTPMQPSDVARSFSGSISQTSSTSLGSSSTKKRSFYDQNNDDRMIGSTTVTATHTKASVHTPSTTATKPGTPVVSTGSKRIRENNTGEKITGKTSESVKDSASSASKPLVSPRDKSIDPKLLPKISPSTISKTNNTGGLGSAAFLDRSPSGPQTSYPIGSSSSSSNIHGVPKTFVSSRIPSDNSLPSSHGNVSNIYAVISQNTLCSMCECTVVDAVVANCGNLFCRRCFESAIKSQLTALLLRNTRRDASSNITSSLQFSSSDCVLCPVTNCETILADSLFLNSMVTMIMEQLHANTTPPITINVLKNAVITYTLRNLCIRLPWLDNIVTGTGMPHIIHTDKAYDSSNTTMSSFGRLITNYHQSHQNQSSHTTEHE